MGAYLNKQPVEIKMKEPAPKELTIPKTQLNEAPINLLDERYGDNDKLSASEVAFRHSGNTWEPSANYISVVKEDGENAYKFVQKFNSTVQSLWIWYYDFQSKADRSLVGYMDPMLLKIVGNSSEAGDYTFSFDIKVPSKPGVPYGYSVDILCVSYKSDRGGTYSSSTTTVAGDGIWKRVSGTINLGTANPYFAIYVQTSMALDNNPFYIKNMMLNKGTNDKYYPSRIKHVYKYPTEATGGTNVTTVSGVSTGTNVTNIANIINGYTSPGASIIFYTNSTGNQNKASIMNIKYKPNIPNDAYIKQMGLHVITYNGNANVKIDGVSITGTNLPGLADVWNTFLTAIVQQTRFYTARDSEMAQAQTVKNDTTYYDVVMTRSNNPATFTMNLINIMLRVLYTLPQKDYYTGLKTIANFKSLKIKNLTNIPEENIIFRQQTILTQGELIGSLIDNDIKQKLLDAKTFEIYLINVPNTYIIPSEILKFEEES